jgi:adenine phosphoribosyltransferase
VEKNKEKAAGMKEYYELNVAGLTRRLPICQLNEKLCIAGFVIFGDVELTVNCARELLKLLPEYDYLLAPEAKAIPLVYEMARRAAGTSICLRARRPNSI